MIYTSIVEANYTGFGNFNIPGILQHVGDDVAFFKSLQAVEFK